MRLPAWRRSGPACRRRGSRGAVLRRTAAPPTPASRARRSSSSTRRKAAWITSTRSIETPPTTTERSLRAGEFAVAALGAMLLASGVTVSAHRYDEYLQASRIAITPAGVRLEVSLTPGIAVADDVIREVDTNHDAVLSAAERPAYAQRLRPGLALRFDH